MKRLLLSLILGTLSLGTFAQEAFYIYRNDGDFNGFFYDEVVEMRYSKLALDSVEHEQYVTYEVELADTVYRIPLAAIDSIGFQQPEIRFNPKVKWMEQEGLCQYVIDASQSGVAFKNIPENMIPQVGDVLLGLPTDSIAKEKYVEGSFCCIIDKVNKYDSGVVMAFGHAADQLSDVFDQFITIEEVATDTLGNVLYRRIAGCTPEGLPRNIKAESGESSLNLINFEATLTRQWQPSDDSSVELTADVGVVLTFRAIYDISWSRFFVSLEHDLVVKTKPSIGLSVSKGFEFDTGELLPVGEILFPATCPMFAINPLPSFFLRGEGKLETRLNMPQVRIGIGQHYVMDSRTFFPITLGLHLGPDENETPTSEMLDLTAQATLSGYVQAGIKFHGDIFTASWMKKIFRVYIGTLLYVGPKVSGEYKVSMDMWQMEGAYLYETLTNSHLNIALLSLDLEAKGSASLFGKEAEKKFFDKNWSFLTDTIHLAPRIKELTADSHDGVVDFCLTTYPDKLLGYCWGEIAISDGEQELQRIGNFSFSSKDSIFTCSASTAGLKAEGYDAYLILHCGSYPEISFEDFVWGLGRTAFTPAPEMNMNTEYLHFGARDNLQKVVTFTTNCRKENIRLYNSLSWLKGGSIQTIDEQAGKYCAVLNATENYSLFDRTCPKSAQPAIILWVGSQKFSYPIEVYQDAPELTNVRLNVYGALYFGSIGSNGHPFTFPDTIVTATRTGDNKVEISGSCTIREYKETGASYTKNYTETVTKRTISCCIEKLDSLDQYRKFTNGQITDIKVYESGSKNTYTNEVDVQQKTMTNKSVTFNDIIQEHKYVDQESFTIVPSTSSYDYTVLVGSGTDEHYISQIPTAGSYFDLNINVNPPAE